MGSIKRARKVDPRKTSDSFGLIVEDRWGFVYEAQYRKYLPSSERRGRGIGVISISEKGSYTVWSHILSF